MFPVAEECFHSVKPFSFSHSVPASELAGDGQEGEMGTAGSADLNLLKGYSIPYDVALSNKHPRKGRGNRGVSGYGASFPRKGLHVLIPCFPINC